MTDKRWVQARDRRIEMAGDIWERENVMNERIGRVFWLIFIHFSTAGLNREKITAVLLLKYE